MVRQERKQNLLNAQFNKRGENKKGRKKPKKQNVKYNG